ncbi:AbrB/MazE/SpoVT family DNA-binding domain-containing protein [Candidatus Microgenomates bacterium]|nr:AbrB/MazE/SpoVT family DNA-binding domain-containing protein [Candidatus Microgenomates bacterium]
MKQMIDIQEEWLRVLTKGMITIPKSWRDEFGFKEGEMIKARKLADKIIIDPVSGPVPYRIYSSTELQQFINDDKLPESLRKKIDRKFKKKQ